MKRQKDIVVSGHEIKGHLMPTAVPSNIEKVKKIQGGWENWSWFAETGHARWFWYCFEQHLCIILPPLFGPLHSFFCHITFLHKLIHFRQVHVESKLVRAFRFHFLRSLSLLWPWIKTTLMFLWCQCLKILRCNFWNSKFS